MEKKTKGAELAPDEAQRAEAIEGIRQGLADIEAGRHVLLEEFEKAMREKYNLPREAHDEAEQRLLAALESPKSEMTPEDWKELRENVINAFPTTSTSEAAREAIADSRLSLTPRPCALSCSK